MIAPGTGVRVYLACGVTDTLLIVRHLHISYYLYTRDIWDRGMGA